jgi:hypothetical protein
VEVHLRPRQWISTERILALTLVVVRGDLAEGQGLCSGLGFAVMNMETRVKSCVVGCPVSAMARSTSGVQSFCYIVNHWLGIFGKGEVFVFFKMSHFIL